MCSIQENQIVICPYCCGEGYIRFVVPDSGQTLSTSTICMTCDGGGKVRIKFEKVGDESD